MDPKLHLQMSILKLDCGYWLGIKFVLS